MGVITLIDSNETLMYQSGRDAGYAEGFEDGVKVLMLKLGECVCTGEYANGRQYKYILYEDYEAAGRELIG